MAINFRASSILCLLWAQLCSPTDSLADTLRLIESSGAPSSSLSLTLYWPESRAQDLEARVLFRPSATPEKKYVIALRGAWFDDYGSNEDQRVYILRLEPFPAMPLGGQGDLVVEVFARGKKMAPLVIRSWVSIDRGATLITPSTLRTILVPDK